MQLFNGVAHPLDKVRFSKQEVIDAHLEKGLTTNEKAQVQ